MLEKDIKFHKKIYLMAQKAEPLPPLGTILGNVGVNTIKFCEEFNSFTKELPSYFSLQVSIAIYENKTFKFMVNKPSSSHLLNLLKFEKKVKVIIKNRLNEKTLNCVKLKDFIQLALFKYPLLSLNKSIPILWGTVKSMNISIV